MKIVHAYPPNIDAIDAAFKVRGQKGVLFTYGDTIYVPGGEEIPRELKAHEGVHFSRQTNVERAILAWWDRYIADPEFRLAEELPAHRAEYRQFCADHRDWQRRSRFLNAIAERLASPLYGKLMRLADARREIAK